MSLDLPVWRLIASTAVALATKVVEAIRVWRRRRVRRRR